MPIESITTYEKIELRRPVLLPHSRLNHIEPLGIGTAQVESLSGYITRLAASHCVFPLALCLGEILPVIDQIKSSQKDGGCQSYGRYPRPYFNRAAPAINGMGVTARDWVHALESLTLHSNLHCLTTLTWRNVISIQCWLRPLRAWCPICYQEQKEEGKIIYEQLLWTLKTVTVCGVHYCSLSTACPHCHKTQRALHFDSRPGYCCLCKEWLGATKRIDPNELKINAANFAEDLRTACEIGKLLASSPEIIEAPKSVGITKAINVCIDHLADGNLPAFARRFWIAEVVVRKLSRGEGLPRINTLLKICSRTGIAPLNFLHGNVNFTDEEKAAVRNQSEAGDQQSSIPRKHTFRKCADEERVLTMALNESPPPSLYTVARRLAYRFPSAIYRLHSTSSRQITKRYREFARELHRQQNTGQICGSSEARGNCESALIEDPPPSVGEVARHLGYKKKDAEPIRNLYPDFYKLLKARRAEYDRRVADARLSELQKALREALREEPPPSLLVLAERYRVDSRQFKKHYPELCVELAERRAQFNDRRSHHIRSILEAALNEVPVPPLREMARRAGIRGKSSLSRHFPDISREVVKRRKEAQRRRAEETRQTLEQTLEQALSETPPPSVKAVCRRLGYESRSLYHKYSATCRRISARYMAYCSERAARKKQDMYEQVRKAVLELHGQGVNLTTNRISKLVRPPALVKRPAFREMLQALRSELNLP